MQDYQTLLKKIYKSYLDKYKESIGDSENPQLCIFKSISETLSDVCDTLDKTFASLVEKENEDVTSQCSGNECICNNKCKCSDEFVPFDANKIFDDEDELDEFSNDDCIHCDEDEEPDTAMIKKPETICSLLLKEIDELPLTEDEIVKNVVDYVLSALNDKKNKPYVLHKQTPSQLPSVEVGLPEYLIDSRQLFNSYIAEHIQTDLKNATCVKDVVFGKPTSTNDTYAIYLLLK